MPACFFALPQVRTPFATFMYDDDVLSPFWSDMVAGLERWRADVVMGFSAEGDVRDVVSFARVAQARLATPSFLLRAFCGCGHELSRHGLPYSPICCLTRADRLLAWAEEVKRFTRGRPLREHFMTKRNAGPDLLIYFHSILNHEREIPVLDGPVAQFSAHVGSMTSNFEPTDLTIGYWLARVWLSDQLRARRRARDGGWVAAYTIKQGVRLLWKRVRRGRVEWLGSLAGEVVALAGRSLASRCACSFLKCLLIQLLPRGWRPRFGLSTRTEAL